MILAGGLGTRLRAVVADRPKPMAEVAGRPFITFLLEQLLRYGFQRAVLCVGHMGECVPPVLGHTYGALELVYSFEPTALGTGGALRNAANLIRETDVLVLNGDSFCDIDLGALDRVHRGYGAAATLAVLWQSDRRRSGAVTVDDRGRVVAFDSRPSTPAPGLINAGVYMLRRDVLHIIEPGRKVSLEDELFPTLVERRELFAWQVEARFIDIGTPESYDAAQIFF
jgi:D-glycero-alpha-D-manno-heptose 1-phosphate guanylyltransferase